MKPQQEYIQAERALVREGIDSAFFDPSCEPAPIPARQPAQPPAAAIPASAASMPPAQPEREPQAHVGLSRRLLDVMRDVAYIQKGDKLVNNQCRFVSHDQVVAAIRKPLVEHGVITAVTVLSHSQDGNRTEADVEVIFINADDPADRMAVRAFGYGIDGGDKGPGKAVSYAVKYVLLKTFCLETGDDPDNAGETQHERRDAKQEAAAMLDKASRAQLMRQAIDLWGKLDPRLHDAIRQRHTKSMRDMSAPELRAVIRNIQNSAEDNRM